MKQNIQLIFISFLFAFVGVFFSACDHDDWVLDRDLLLTDEDHGSLKNENVVATGKVKNVTENSATILFSANQNYKDLLKIHAGIQYSMNEKFTDGYTWKIELDNFTSSDCEVMLNDLKPNTTYYYRVYAEIEDEVSSRSCCGETKYFTTSIDFSPGEAVDLGLSVKWASKNIGATEAKDEGVVFSWGGTEPCNPHYAPYYSWYSQELSVLTLLGVVNDNYNLNPSYDAATQGWGGKWRMPTKDEFQELIDKCIWVEEGWNYRIIGPNRNYIYLSNERFWTSTGTDHTWKYSEKGAYYFSRKSIDTIDRNNAYSIRPVMK